MKLILILVIALCLVVALGFLCGYIAYLVWKRNNFKAK